VLLAPGGTLFFCLRFFHDITFGAQLGKKAIRLEEFSLGTEY
jgi:hypothetical protein